MRESTDEHSPDYRYRLPPRKKVNWWVVASYGAVAVSGAVAVGVVAAVVQILI